MIWQFIFRSCPLKPAEDGNQQLAAMGRTIYQDGVPDSNIVACIACHGPHAEGIREIPRLGGLAFSYLQRRLEQWGEGYNKICKASDAARCKPVVCQANCGARVVPQFY